MSRDYSKYNVAGVAENLNKRKLVLEIVKDYIAKHPDLTLSDIKRTFPDEIQGSKGFIRDAIYEQYDPKRFFSEDKISTPLFQIVVSNQWGDNLERFIELAESLGYQIEKTNAVAAPESQPESASELQIEFDKRYPYSFIQLLKDKRQNGKQLDLIDAFIEKGLRVSHQNYSAAKIFEALSNRSHEDDNDNFAYGFEYKYSDYDEAFAVCEDVHELKDKLSEQNLIDIIVEFESIEDLGTIEFKTFYPAYFKAVIEKLAELEDAELVAEFIVSQALDFSSFVEETGYEYGEDWLVDLCNELLMVFYAIDCSASEYENEITIDGSHFGITMDCNIDYIQIAEEIIAQVI